MPPVTLPTNILGALDFGMNAEEQVALTQHVLNHGNMVSMRHVGKDGWLSLPVRRPKDSSLNANDFRMAKGVDWDWIESPATEMAQDIVSRVAHLFESITRVTLLVQRVGVTIAMHRDPVFGNDYGNGPHRPDRGVPTHREHANNFFMSLKGAITEKHGDNGCPVIRVPDNGPDLRYDTGDRFFLINEVYALHGARVCDHHRGVIWIDGWFNRDQFMETERRSVPVTLLEGSTPTITTPWHA